MSEYRNWTPALAARVGYLVGLGASFEAIACDPAFAFISRKSLKSVLTRWDLRPTTIAPEDIFRMLPARDRDSLVASAQWRGMASETLVLRLLHVIVTDKLINAILDDEKNNNGCREARRVD
jgi:hypothetical protein